jgi:hypothetical protein
MQRYREISLVLPEDLYGFFAFLKVFPAPPFPEELHRKTMCGIICYCGPLDKVEEAFRPVRKFRPLRFELTIPLSAGNAAVLERRLFGANSGRGDRRTSEIWRTITYSPLDDALLSSRRRSKPRRPSRDRFQLSRREVVDGYCRSRSGPANAEKITAWTKDYWEACIPTVWAVPT